MAKLRSSRSTHSSVPAQPKSRALTTNLLWAAAGVGAVATGVMFYVNAREAGVSGVVSF